MISEKSQSICPPASSPFSVDFGRSLVMQVRHWIGGQINDAGLVGGALFLYSNLAKFRPMMNHRRQNDCWKWPSRAEPGRPRVKTGESCAIVSRHSGNN